MAMSEKLDLVIVGQDFVAARPDLLPNADAPGTLGGENTNDPFIPRTRDDLTSGEETVSEFYTVQQASELKIPFLAFASKGEQSVFVQQYSKYREVSQASGKLRYGVAVRWVISIVKLNGSARTEGAPSIAASVELGYLRANAKFEVIGLHSQAISKAVPAPGDLTVDQYALFAQRLEAIKELFWDEKTVVAPTLLQVSSSLMR